MKGFDDEFKNIVDYILEITLRIWEGKQPELCHRYYSEDCPVYTLAGYTQGAEEVTQNTIHTQNGFPDRTLHADNIIWGGNDNDGFHTSHLINTAMTNLGPSEFGEPTGRHAQFQVIAHCVVRENRIVEEWLVRDNFSLCKQLGFDPLERAKELATQPLTDLSKFTSWLTSEFRRVAGSEQNAPIDGDHSARGAELARQIRYLWNVGELNEISSLYASDAVVHASARPDLKGLSAIREFFEAMRGALPDCRLSVDYVCENSMAAGEHVALRWTIAGHHLGATLWGPATRAPVLILGESHYRLHNGRIVEEWLVFDELSVMTQVERARIAAQS